MKPWDVGWSLFRLAWMKQWISTTHQSLCHACCPGLHWKLLSWRYNLHLTQAKRNIHSSPTEIQQEEQCSVFILLEMQIVNIITNTLHSQYHSTATLIRIQNICLIIFELINCRLLHLWNFSKIISNFLNFLDVSTLCTPNYKYY